MYAQESGGNTAVIYNFPNRPRIAANRFAAQMRHLDDIEAARHAPVIAESGWYHEEAVAAAAKPDRARR